MLDWVSENRYRVLVTVDPRGVERRRSPASTRIDFVKALADAGETAGFDPDTVEVVAYDAADKPAVYDASRPGYEKHLLPWRIEPYYGVDYVDLSFAMPDHKHTQYAVYFDTHHSGLGKPKRYRGLVGDGDYFVTECTRREIGASHMDCFADLDGDGDLDLFKVTAEPFIYCYENVGENRFVYRGRLTSGGELFALPMGSNNRSWATIMFHDWNGDGRQDLFVTCSDGPEANHIIRYENVTQPGGPLTFEFRGRILTESGKGLGSTWFTAVTIVDWDGDGKKDLLLGREERIEFCRNIGPADDISDIRVADPVVVDLPAEGAKLCTARVACADMDGDGDLDLLVANQGAQLYYFANVGTRTDPVFAPAVAMPCRGGGGHGGITVADFSGDGLLDYAVGNLWEAAPEPGERRLYARLYVNVGTRTEPRFEERDAYHGCPYTEGFQICDAGRQNTARAVDWNNDGKTDLIATGERGGLRLFRNITGSLFPVFADGVPIASGLPVEPRCSICDWNNDGRKDLVITGWDGKVLLFLNEGTDAEPAFGPPVMLRANGKVIDGTAWTSVLVCDWDNDGKKDLILGIGGEKWKSENYEWPHVNDDPSLDVGFLFYANIGTDAEPVLAFPKWIEAGGKPIGVLRPNLGSFVDWDGDGKKHFIACEFENVIYLHRNSGSGKTGEEPVFADPEGQAIVKPSSPQLISGADAVDWHGDGDVDIVTGQGHSGTGLRFFSRGYINDFVDDTFPAVRVGECERRKK